MTTYGPDLRSKKRDLSLYWWGHTASAFGSVFTAITVPVLAVTHFDAAPGQIALISAAAMLPMLLLSLPAGVLADRITRPRRTLILLDTLSAVAVAVVCLGVAQDSASIAWLIALAAVQGGVGMVLEIVYFIHLRQLAEQSQLGKARARLQAGQYAAGFLGRLLAGPTIVALGPAAALALDGASYVLSAAALLCMAPSAPRICQPSSAAPDGIGGKLRNLGAGLRIFMENPFQRALLVTLFVPGMASTGVAVLTAPFLLRVVKVPTEAYGWMFALSGLTGLAGSFLAGRLLDPRRDARVMTMLFGALAAASGLLLPAAAGPLSVAATLAALGIGLSVLFGSIANVALSSVIVADVPEHATGRVMAMLQSVAAISSLGGALAGGALGEWIGVRPAIWVLAGSGLAAFLICLPSALRAARRLRGLPTDTEPQPVAAMV